MYQLLIIYTFIISSYLVVFIIMLYLNTNRRLINKIKIYCSSVRAVRFWFFITANGLRKALYQFQGCKCNTADLIGRLKFKIIHSSATRFSHRFRVKIIIIYLKLNIIIYKINVLLRTFDFQKKKTISTTSYGSYLES